MRIKLVLLTENENFAKNFGEFILNEHRTSFSIEVYTNLDMFMSKSLDKTDIVVIDHELYESTADVVGLSDVITVLLHNGRLPGHLQETNNISIFDESNTIIQYFFDVYQREKKVQINNNVTREHKLVAFFSPIGGVGKTTLALVYAKLLAAKGYKTLFLSLDHFFDESYFFGGKDKEDLTFLFATLTESTNIIKDIEDLSISDPANENLSYIRGFSKYMDRLDVSQNQWDLFCDKLVQLPEYDMIVIDVPTDLDKKASALLNSIDQMIMVTGKTTIEKAKFKAFSNYMSKLPFFSGLERSDSVSVIYNNSRNVDWNRPVEEDGFFSVDIGFDSDYKKYIADQSRVELRHDTHVGEQISTLIDRLVAEPSSVLDFV